MDESQVDRISRALGNSARAIDGINRKFDEIDRHLISAASFNKKMSTKINESLGAIGKFDQAFNNRIESALETVESATDELTDIFEHALLAVKKFDLQGELFKMPKVLIPLAIPLTILLIELAISNAYLGILLASLPQVQERYSNYLLANAFAVLLGLFVSTVWLGMYRFWIARQSSIIRRHRQALTMQATLRLKGQTGVFTGTSQGPLGPSLEAEHGDHLSDQTSDQGAAKDNFEHFACNGWERTISTGAVSEPRRDNSQCSPDLGREQSRRNLLRNRRRFSGDRGDRREKPEEGLPQQRHTEEGPHRAPPQFVTMEDRDGTQANAFGSPSWSPGSASSASMSTSSPQVSVMSRQHLQRQPLPQPARVPQPEPVSPRAFGSSLDSGTLLRRLPSTSSSSSVPRQRFILGVHTSDTAEAPIAASAAPGVVALATPRVTHVDQS